MGVSGVCDGQKGGAVCSTDIIDQTNLISQDPFRRLVIDQSGDGNTSCFENTDKVSSVSAGTDQQNARRRIGRQWCIMEGHVRLVGPNIYRILSLGVVRGTPGGTIIAAIPPKAV
jgi:hypothetical protein